MDAQQGGNPPLLNNNEGGISTWARGTSKMFVNTESDQKVAKSKVTNNKKISIISQTLKRKTGERSVKFLKMVFAGKYQKLKIYKTISDYILPFPQVGKRCVC